MIRNGILMVLKWILMFQLRSNECVQIAVRSCIYDKLREKQEVKVAVVQGKLTRLAGLNVMDTTVGQLC